MPFGTETALAVPRDGTLWPDVLQINLPLSGVTWSEQERGPLTDRLGGRVVAGGGAVVLFLSCLLASRAHEGMSTLLAVALFLRGHARNDAGIRMPIAHHGKLPCIDAGRAELTGLIDPQHRRAIGGLGTATRSRKILLRAHALRPLRPNNAKMASAPPTDKRPL